MCCWAWPAKVNSSPWQPDLSKGRSEIWAIALQISAHSWRSCNRLLRPFSTYRVKRLSLRLRIGTFPANVLPICGDDDKCEQKVKKKSSPHDDPLDTSASGITTNATTYCTMTCKAILCVKLPELAVTVAV